MLSLFFSALLAVNLAHAAGPTPVFRFSLSVEPSGIDPLRISSSESNYFLVNVLRGLYFVDAKGVAQPELAESCRFKDPRTVRCTLRKGIQWSDGKAITAQDFVYSWRRLVSPGAKGLGITILAGVSNAVKAHAGSVPPEQLGIRALNETELEVSLEENDPEFIQRLTHPALGVVREGSTYDREGAPKAAVSGPYKVVEWSRARIRLETNPNYFKKSASSAGRPPVEVLILEDDETAMNLYREGTLTLLRRLPTHYIKRYKGTDELVQIPVARFDYLGFGPKLRGEREFRQALAAALNYPELAKLYDALGVPGCPSISEEWMSKVPCHKFDLSRAQKLWKKVPEELRTKTWMISFSKLGGDDNQKGMEWMQAQWKKHLGLKSEIRAVEQGAYVQELKTAAPDLFRKGVGIDRATCLAAVEIFLKDDPENYIKLDSTEYSKRVDRLKSARSLKDSKTACAKAVEYLIDEAEVIPLGRIHFSMLAKPEFKGWHLNPLNQLDLSGLSR